LEGAIIESVSVSKRGGRLLLKLSDGRILRVDKKATLGCAFTEGMWLSEEQIAELSKHSGLSADESAAIILARRQYSVSELSKKLEEKGYTEDEIASAVEKLKSGGFLDDESYALEVVSYVSSRLLSRRAAMAELFKRGVDRETANSAVGRMPSDTDTAVLLIKRKFGPGAAESRESRAKIYTYLRGKGFSSGDISDALYRISSGEADI
jgi:regulatory protein